MLTSRRSLSAAAVVTSLSFNLQMTPSRFVCDGQKETAASRCRRQSAYLIRRHKARRRARPPMAVYTDAITTGTTSVTSPPTDAFAPTTAGSLYSYVCVKLVAMIHVLLLLLLLLLLLPIVTSV
jgi:hypothetical protein